MNNPQKGNLMNRNLLIWEKLTSHLEDFGAFAPLLLNGAGTLSMDHVIRKCAADKGGMADCMLRRSFEN